jgi:hypothetical protein
MDVSHPGSSPAPTIWATIKADPRWGPGQIFCEGGYGRSKDAKESVLNPKDGKSRSINVPSGLKSLIFRAAEARKLPRFLRYQWVKPRFPSARAFSLVGSMRERLEGMKASAAGGQFQK